MKRSIYKKYIIGFLVVLLLSLIGVLYMWYGPRLVDSIEYARAAYGCHKVSPIKHSKEWCQKQRKYLGNNTTVERVQFMSRVHAGLPHKKITRNGMLYIKDNAPATVLICHGFMACKDDISVLRWMFSDFNVMTFDFRAHGDDSKGQICTFGFDEMNDVVGAAEFIKSHSRLQGKPLIVYGFSMGAVASILAQSKYPHLFDCAVWDCPFDSASELIDRMIGKLKISFMGAKFPCPGRSYIKKYIYHPYVQGIFKYSMRAMANASFGKIETNIRPVSPKTAIKKVSIPSFLITCNNDEKAPPSALLKLYKNSPAGFKRLWIASGRSHYDPVISNPDEYAYRVKKFISNYLDRSYEKKKKMKIIQGGGGHLGVIYGQ